MDLYRYLFSRIKIRLDSEWFVLFASVIAISMFLAGVIIPGDQGYYLIFPAYAVVAGTWFGFRSQGGK